MWSINVDFISFYVGYQYHQIAASPIYQFMQMNNLEGTAVRLIGRLTAHYKSCFVFARFTLITDQIVHSFTQWSSY